MTDFENYLEMKAAALPFLRLWCLTVFGAMALAESPASSSARDISLTDCLRIAVDHNPQLRAASEQYLAAQGQALKLHAILYPTVNAQGLTAPTTLYVQINQVIYSRATFPQLRISRLAQDQAVINYRQTLDDIVFQIRQAFANALAARQSDDLIRAYNAGQANALASAQQLFEAGKIQKSAVLSVQVTDNLHTQRQNTTELGVSESRLALDNLLGQELPENSRLTGNLATRAPDRLDQETLIAQALRDRADLKLLESLHLTGQQQILVDLKSALPVIGASSNSAFQPPALGKLSNFDLERNYNEPEIQRQQGNSQLPLSLYFSWLIFDGGALVGIRASDTAQLETQEVAIAALKRSIPAEVIAAISAIRAAQDSLRQLDSSPAPAELRHAAQLDYQAGRIRQVDLVDLESDLLGQDQVRLDAQLRLTLALAALDHAMGRGLLPMPATNAHP
jgi:outer membrane protein TolC